MKSKLNTDYSGVPIQGFAPEPTLVAVTLDVAVNSTTYSAFCFDKTADIYFNGVASPAYTGWPANEPLYLTNKINSVTFSVSGTLMYMSAA